MKEVLALPANRQISLATMNDGKEATEVKCEVEPIEMDEDGELDNHAVINESYLSKVHWQ